MEEDGGVKAPVTRLRRRLSVEHLEDTKSPSTPSTPTKKRGRLAAKPQLELIDENAPQSPKKTTRRSIARDVVEEERPLTPARRSTRAKSNTSIVSETPQEDERPQTPARRSTRIKSNTSLISETINLDSPRAKRAVARRNSQLGSDTETTVTPARARRTRKDSTTSVDKQATPTVAEMAVTPGRTRQTRKDSTTSDKLIEATPGITKSLITLAMSEELETNTQQSNSKADSDNIRSENSSPSNSRKSPRLKAKINRKSNSEGYNSNDKKPENHEEPKNTEESNQDNEMKMQIRGASDANDNLSGSSTNSVKELGSQTKKNNRSHLNKSTSAIEGTDNSKTKRHRTKSWTTLSASFSNDSNFHSDNENAKKGLKKHEKLLSKFQAGSGDSMLNKSKTEDLKACNNEINLNTSSKKNKILSKDGNEQMNTPNKSIKLNKSASETPKPTDTSNESNKENVLDANTENNSNVTEILFEKSPTELKTMVIMEDSDSDTENDEKKTKPTFDGDDQCVPVVYQPPKQANNQEYGGLNVNEDPRVDDSCEPMDIDVTIPDNVSATDTKENTEQQQSNKTPGIETRKSPRKSSQNMPQEIGNTANESLNKSKRKSSSQFFTQDLEKSLNENKSTLILSQIKDVSNTDNSVSKSPVSNELSKSVTVPATAKEGAVNKNLSVNYLTSTPVQQKDNKERGLQMNSSVITPNNENRKEIKHTKESSRKYISVVSNSSKNDTSDEDSDDEESKRNDFLDSEAEDASDNYESGDSQDEDEKQYEKDNEIYEKGETLTSEEELSNDTDYEKDSFVVSSDEEDNELLSGSGDDLDMSDKELTMSAKSKKKYDERKKKEQKKASREMYEARHKLDKFRDADCNTSKPKNHNRLRLDSALSESGEDNNMPPKKNKRMRLESTFETSDTKFEKEVQTKNDQSISKSNNEEIGHKKKKSKRLSEYECNESGIYDKEITISEGATEKDDPLSIQVKLEKKTPQKELDISTVHFTCREEIENVKVNENVSMAKPNESMDPLQVTMTQESEEDYNSSISENEEITKNYDSVLNDLNKENNHKQVKTGDMSLDLDKKQKKSKESVIEELNLTIAKKLKKKANVQLDQPNEKTVKRIFTKLSANDDASMDSIDLNLLFSDEGTEKSDDCGNQTISAESFIPLKRTEATTDIRSNIDAVQNAQNESFNMGSKKYNKRKSQQTEEIVIDNSNDDGEEVKFFMDTTGTRFDAEKSTSESPNTSRKKKNKNNNLSFSIQPIKDDDSDSNEAPAEVSFKSEKNRDRSKRISEILEAKQDLLTQLVKAPESEKNKKKKLSESQNSVQAQEDILEKQANVSLIKTPHSEKKNKKLSEPETGNKKMAVETHNISLENAGKKKNKNMSINLQDGATAQSNDRTYQKEIHAESKDTSKSRKRKSSGNHINEETTQVPENPISQNTLTVDDTVGNKKKKRKISSNNEDNKVVPENKKRKEREEDNCSKKSKVMKPNSLDQIHVPRLPTSILSQLDDKPKKEFIEMKKSKLVSTTDFIVEETKKRKNKPSDFLEESVYLNMDKDNVEKKSNAKAKKPKVLPFLPTVCTSYSGFTTNFQVTVLPKKFEFVAQSTETSNFKKDYLKDKRVKKLRTYDMYKKQRNNKFSKY